MNNLDAILRAQLPAELHSSVSALAQLLSKALSGQIDQREVQTRFAANEGFRTALSALRGYQVEVNEAVISFGSGAQVGDVTITGDVAGRDVIKLTVNIGTPQVQQSVTTNYGTVIGQQIVQSAPLPALFQLRAPVGDFVGREKEIEQLVTTLRKAVEDGAAAAISGVRGMGGIGKTELAYKVAHELRDVFPDGQILVELRGATSPVTPEDAMREVLFLLGEQSSQEEPLSSLQARYRARLTRRHILVVADDAKGVTQVRPLLPPAGCAFLVTSRNRFSLPGMRPIDLGTLPSKEAEQLLLEICPRIGEHTPKLAELCGYLPLALRVSAGLLEANDDREVGRYVEQLSTERLKHLTDPNNTDDAEASVAASLRLSYNLLEPNVQRGFCQCSIIPGSFSLEAAIAVIDESLDAENVLGTLRRFNFIEWDEATEYYTFHDLVRELGQGLLQDRKVVWHRYVQHFRDVATQLHNMRKEWMRLGSQLTMEAYGPDYEAPPFIFPEWDDNYIKENHLSQLEERNIYNAFKWTQDNREIDDVGHMYLDFVETQLTDISLEMSFEYLEEIYDVAKRLGRGDIAKEAGRLIDNLFSPYEPPIVPVPGRVRPKQQE